MNHKNILIAEDNESVRRVLSKCVGADGRSVLTAADGIAALELARLHLPDLIILDVQMPGRNGYEVCMELRAASKTRAIPILMLTGLGSAEEDSRGIGAPADRYLAKPFNFNELETCVREMLAARMPS